MIDNRAQEKEQFRQSYSSSAQTTWTMTIINRAITELGSRYDGMRLRERKEFKSGHEERDCGFGLGGGGEEGFNESRPPPR